VVHNILEFYFLRCYFTAHRGYRNYSCTRVWKKHNFCSFQSNLKPLYVLLLHFW